MTARVSRFGGMPGRGGIQTMSRRIDLKEGVAAFREKRLARFRGK